ncbi:conserved hypothetical protein [Paraburkholderia atlantica]|uniref:DUF3331 domain-containing protein n=1 Tax=Paraburkholderia atlantica TaxID=2654982 RepID=D5WJG2_PARAM|nr:conserved hypothetical protein [Paraburkholderia atlantica]
MILEQPDICDPWARTVGLLGQLSGELPVNGDTSVTPLFKPEMHNLSTAPVAGVTVRLLERSTATRVTLAWSDPSRCAYHDQEWQLTRARHSGVCAISGMKIRRGEVVYRPRATRPRMPLNADAMIHPIALQGDQ